MSAGEYQGRVLFSCVGIFSVPAPRDMMHHFINLVTIFSFSKHLMNSYCVPGTMLCIRELRARKPQSLPPQNIVGGDICMK